MLHGMTNAAIAGALLAGFVAGSVALSSVVRWLAALLNSGPWVLAAVALVAYFVRDEPGAGWLFAGFAGSVAFFGLLTVRKASKPQ